MPKKPEWKEIESKKPESFRLDAKSASWPSSSLVFSVAQGRFALEFWPENNEKAIKDGSLTIRRKTFPSIITGAAEDFIFLLKLMISSQKSEDIGQDLPIDILVEDGRLKSLGLSSPLLVDMGYMSTPTGATL